MEMLHFREGFRDGTDYRDKLPSNGSWIPGKSSAAGSQSAIACIVSA